MSFPMLSWEQANPGITGAQKINDIFHRILQNQQLGIKNRYAPDTLQAALLKAQQENQYYPQDIMSQIRTRNATAGKTEAEIPWVGKLAQSEIGQRGSQAGKYGAETTEQELMNDLYRRIVNGNNIQSGQTQPQMKVQPQEQATNVTQQGNMPVLPPTNEDLLRKNIEDTILKHPKDNPEKYAELMARKQQQIATPVNLNQMAQQEVAPVQQIPQQQIQSQFSIEEQNKRAMQAIADIQAMKRGQALPSMEAENAANKEVAVKKAIEYVDLTKKYSTNESAATTSLRNLDQLENSINKLSNIETSPAIAEKFKKMLGGPEMQMAIKEANTLLIGQLKSKFGGLGQLRNMEMQKLIEAMPSANMTKEGAQKVIKQLRIEFKVAQVQGQMAQNLGRYTKDPQELQSVIDMAARVFSPVDETGEHPERLRHWEKYATPTAINAMRNGEIYIPRGVKPQDLSPEIRRELISRMP